MKRSTGVLVIVAALTGIVRTQEIGDRRPVIAPTVFIDALAYATADTAKSRLEVYCQVPYSEIRFLREKDDYVGLYDITVTITTPEGETVWNRVHSVEVRTKDFSQTSSNRMYSLKQLPFELKPGPYDLRVEVRDPESKKSATMRRRTLITDFAKDTVALSDVMLISRLTTRGDKHTIVPNISGNVGDEANGFYMFFELYSNGILTPVHLVATVFGANRDSVWSVDQHVNPTERTQQIFMKFTDLNLPIGPYTVIITAYTEGSPGRRLATTSRQFAVRWSDIPFSITDIDRAIDQMRFVAREGELEYIRAGTTPEERRKRFLEYWNKRDPDPQTPRNELMEEYYHRVDYANRNFGHYVDGWRTDRGMIYIRYGPPENVERHPFETNTRPYEVWHYYNLNYEFVFVDETGFGDYRLRYPTTDLLGRERPTN